MLERDGFALVPRLIEPEEVAFWQDRYAEPVRAGRRNLLDDPEVRRLADDPRLRAFIAVPGIAPRATARAISNGRRPADRYGQPADSPCEAPVRRHPQR